MSEENKAPNWQDVALAEARQIGAMLREKHNMQPAAIPEADLITGIMKVPYTPPPSFTDISLAQLGKQTQVY